MGVQVGFGLVDEKGTLARELHGACLELLAQVSGLENGRNDFSCTGNHGEMGGETGGEGLGDACLVTVVGKVLQYGCCPVLFVLYITIGFDGSIQTTVEAVHTTGIDAHTRYLLRILIVANGLLLDTKRGCLYVVGCRRESHSGWIVDGFRIVADQAAALCRRLVRGEGGAKLRGVDEMELAIGGIAIAVVAADDVQRVAVVANEGEEGVGKGGGGAFVLDDSSEVIKVL